MRRRRAFLISVPSVAIAGCLGGYGEDPYYTVTTKTINRDDGLIRPEVNTVDENISEASTAAIEISVQNRSLQRVTFTTYPERGNWFGSTHSEGDNIVLTNSERVVKEQGQDGPCWREESPGLEAAGNVAVDEVLPLFTSERQYSIAAEYNANCISPGKHRFESEYNIRGSEESINWIFELKIE